MEKKWIDDDLIFPGVKAYIDRLAEGFNLPPAIVVQNLLIRRMAEEDATVDVYGSGQQLLSEFMGIDGELVTGQQLYDIIFEHEKKRLEQERIENLAAVPWEVCSDKDKELLIKYKLDPASKAEKKAAEANIKKLQESGEIGEVETTWNNKKS